MILSCPACGARYLVDASALGPAGRTVRCARCQFQWRQDPPQDMPRRLDPVEPPPPPVSGPRVPPPNLPGFPRPPRRNLEWLGWVGLAGVVAGVIGAGFVYRSEVVAAWPPAGQLYEMLGLVEPGATLDFADIRFERDQTAGRNVLMVKGRVLNHSPAEAGVPGIVVSLVDATGRQLLSETVQAKDARLAPDAATTFESVLSNPPPEAQEVRVTFGPL
ncbi:DUF3426 domain-containing protein [Zavarzinia sp. CC-PAN008]|uniref:DUF3426 domain-containing protein n=1 Tax=Zavarzinia sp. CC-PAN008 TaxID=3243332 RepID=UPI003F74A41E